MLYILTKYLIVCTLLHLNTGLAFCLGLQRFIVPYCVSRLSKLCYYMCAWELLILKNLFNFNHLVIIIYYILDNFKSFTLVLPSLSIANSARKQQKGHGGWRDGWSKGEMTMSSCARQAMVESISKCMWTNSHRCGYCLEQWLGHREEHNVGIVESKFATT